MNIDFKKLYEKGLTSREISNFLCIDYETVFRKVHAGDQVWIKAFEAEKSLTKELK